MVKRLVAVLCFVLAGFFVSGQSFSVSSDMDLAIGASCKFQGMLWAQYLISSLDAELASNRQSLLEKNGYSYDFYCAWVNVNADGELVSVYVSNIDGKEDLRDLLAQVIEAVFPLSYCYGYEMFANASNAEIPLLGRKEVRNAHALMVFEFLVGFTFSSTGVSAGVIW